MAREQLYANLKKYLGKPKACIVCGMNKKQFWARAGIFKAVKCASCGFVWIDPFLTQEGLDIYYHDYIKHRLQQKKKYNQRNKMYEIDVRFVQDHVVSGKLLDIGCSGGFFLSKFSPSFTKYGIEIDSEAVRHAKKKNPFGKNIYCGQFGKERFFDRIKFDCITLRGVIEHMPDARAVLKKAALLLKKGAFLFISATPNVESFCANLYRDKWNQFDPVQHIYYFSADTFSRLVGEFGLKLVAKDYPYLETPYVDLMRDHRKVLKDYNLIKRGRKKEVSRSPAFWGNMMTLLFKKIK